MSATILRFPTPAAEPPVNVDTALDEALREYAYQCLAEVFGPRFATACQAFHHCADEDELAELLAEIDAIP